jgi:hypothetical protein
MTGCDPKVAEARRLERLDLQARGRWDDSLRCLEERQWLEEGLWLTTIGRRPAAGRGWRRDGDDDHH